MSQKPRIHSQESDKMTFSVPPDANEWQGVKKKQWRIVELNFTQNPGDGDWYSIPKLI